ncbi:tRNA 5-methoxyuridine(34)/uridine 5-oxyacetic acid(34) synthase CmoB [Halochromatium roseum]|uniref:tRNA 5-methoxyuridine(34)/uridine 5-oxyacetic acid(34) synthase CmoB n=1 Tax=Halochromatium roseum TaxID=391920 RepID=UPI0019136BC1|nr:tRNA 5-methoxyuridine(34)/uridine 5-oxyacetic acid(34) synthase CmoB [Halochromatium roseum]MBK5939225.1 tRNA 5-methoxyuridine(34)/uridine 5-oxyacetic acid(34) synthase CmoB [Halochromatium roseum]
MAASGGQPRRPEGLGSVERVLLQRFEPFLDVLRASALADWVNPLRQLTLERLQPARHGDLGDWVETLERLSALCLPDPCDSSRVLDQPCVGVAAEQPLSPAVSAQLRQVLEQLHPWRKGPFCLHGIAIDAEWRSDWKWARLADAIAPLPGRRVLDVGCGNGYYGFRALGAGADWVLGIDPTLRFVMQFLALEQLIGAERLAVFPLADDDLPGLCAAAGSQFDTLFSMGVLYHRRDPIQHLARLRDCLRPGGELVLETLVVDRPSDESIVCEPPECERLLDKDAEKQALERRQPGCGPAPAETLIPAGRYARMRNVHAIPSVAVLGDWIRAAGYRDLQLVGLSRTSIEEQRATPWMRFQSLADFLDPNDPSLTIEGHPAPVRALLLAQRAG